jgi:hypothetical protein
MDFPLFVALVIALGFFVAFAVIVREIRAKNMMLWLPSYLKNGRSALPTGHKHLMFCFVDHFEPRWGKADDTLALERVQRWVTKYPAMADQFRDADGVKPTHSFFYPEEEYEKRLFDPITELCAKGYGEVEIHLHHDNDTEAGLCEKINRFKATLHNDHRALPLDPKTGEPVFAFIHGNWCLDNARADGKHCGVNNELEVLQRLGCYVDMTLPAAPDDSQTKKINSIYYATENPHAPKSHNDGEDAFVGGKAKGSMFLIQGPLGLNWNWRKLGVIPRTDSGDIRDTSPPLPVRVDNWVKQHIHVKGRPEWIFVKIHTHGTQESSERAVLGDQVRDMHKHLAAKYNDGKEFSLHYTSAREMFNIAKAAEAGLSGNPGQHRDYIYKRAEFVNRSS